MTTLQLTTEPIEVARSYFLRRSYRARLLTILLLANTLSFADRAILSALVEPIRQELGLSDLQLGMLQGLAFAAMYSLTGIPIGYLAERRNRLGMLAICITVFSVATGLCGLAAGFAQLFLLRVMVGIGEGGYMPPATSLVADHYTSGRRASALAVILLGIPLGFFLGSLLAGMVAQHWGWRTVFFAMSVPGVLISLVMILLLREPPRGLAEGAPPRQVAPSFADVMRELFRQGAFRRLLIAGVICTCALSAIGQFQMVYLLRVHQLSLGQAGLINGLIALVSIGTGMLVGGNLTDWLAHRDRRWYMWLPAIGCTVGAICFAIGFAQTAVTPAVALITIAGVFAFFYSAPAYATVQEIAGVRMRSTAVALFGVFAGLFGAGLGPLFVGIVSDNVARRVFASGDFTALCNRGPSPSADAAIDTACRAAAASGIQGAMIATSLLILIAAWFFYWTSRVMDVAGQAKTSP